MARIWLNLKEVRPRGRQLENNLKTHRHVFTDRCFHSFIKYLFPAYYVPRAELDTKRVKLSKMHRLVARCPGAGLGGQVQGGKASSEQEELSGHQGRGAPGGSPHSDCHLVESRLPAAFLHPEGLADTQGDRNDAQWVPPSWPTATSSLCPGERASPEPGSRRRWLNSIFRASVSLVAQKTSTLQRELPGERHQRPLRRLCLPPGQHSVMDIDGFIFLGTQRTNAVDNCSGTADK